MGNGGDRDGLPGYPYAKHRLTKLTMQLYNLCYTLCNTSLACVMHYTPITHV